LADDAVFTPLERDPSMLVMGQRSHGFRNVQDGDARFGDAHFDICVGDRMRMAGYLTVSEYHAPVFARNWRDSLIDFRDALNEHVTLAVLAFDSFGFHFIPFLCASSTAKNAVKARLTVSESLPQTRASALSRARICGVGWKVTSLGFFLKWRFTGDRMLQNGF
jgi:hypothetical protein